MWKDAIENTNCCIYSTIYFNNSVSLRFGGCAYANNFPRWKLFRFYVLDLISFYSPCVVAVVSVFFLYTFSPVFFCACVPCRAIHDVRCTVHNTTDRILVRPLKLQKRHETHAAKVCINKKNGFVCARLVSVRGIK